MGNNTPLLSNVWYKRFKFVALVVLPALGALYFSIAQIWGLPAAEQVVGTIVALDTFLGLLVKAAESSYDKVQENAPTLYDGNIIKTQSGDGRLVYAIEFETREQQENAHGKDALLLKLVD